MRLTRAWAGLSMAAAALVAMAGCVHPVDGPTPPTTRTGKVTLFERPDGLGQIALQVIDQRKGFGTQSLDLADTWDEVRLRLNSAKLRAPRQASLTFGSDAFTAPRQKTYQTDALGLLPPASDYRLMVTLASSSVVLGQGASESIVVSPGSVATVSIYINTVGDISFFNPDYVTATGSPELELVALGYPELLAGTSVDVLPNFPSVPGDVPASQRFASFYTELRSLDGSLLLATASVPFSPAAKQTLVLPALASGVDESVKTVTVVGLNSAGEVLSTKKRPILAIRPAGLSVDLDPVLSALSPAPVPPLAWRTQRAGSR